MQGNLMLKPSFFPARSKRRQLLKAIGLAAMGFAFCPFLSHSASAADAPAGPKKKILFFTKSSGFQHSVINRKDKPDQLSFAEQILTDIGAANGFEVTCSKDGTLFAPASRDQFDAFVFYTTGDLTTAGTDKTPPISPADKTGLLDAIKNGKGFMALHCGSDTFHSKSKTSKEMIRNVNDKGEDDFDPYIQMLGGEFIVHGSQQPSLLHCVDKKFPGAEALNDSNFTEEWYSLKNFAPDLHVILLQDTAGMKGGMYQRKPFPETWSRMHGKGRVFFTSLGHREDVWQKPEFRNLLIGAMNWTTGRVEADVTPNIKEVAPGADPAPFVDPKKQK
jgi:type 1 glutamine amidotransferase